MTPPMLYTPMLYTHAFLHGPKKVVPLAELPAVIEQARCGGFDLIHSTDEVRFDFHGRLCRRAGGWSYGHVRNGWICAGAGGNNSLRVLEISPSTPTL